MFAANVDSNGIHRLTIRRKRTITQYIAHDGTRKEIKFSSRAKAKACADQLNEKSKYKDIFSEETGRVRRTLPALEIEQEMRYILSVIYQHGGIEEYYAAQDR